MSRHRSTRLVARSGHDSGIAEAVNDFLLYHRRKGHSDNYDRELRSYLIGSESRFGRRRVWSPFVRWAKEHRLSRVRDLSKDAMRSYLDHVREHTSKSDYGKVCAILKRLFGFFVDEQLLENEPLRIERPKRLKAEIKVFTPEEIERMRQIVAKENTRDQAIFMLLLDTGIRASELCNLRFDDVRWERQQLIIRPEIAKNASYRIVPIHGSMKALRKYRSMRGDEMEQCDRLFLAFYHTPVVAKGGVRRNIDKIVFCNSGLTRNGLYFLIAKWGRLANISESRCSPHTFRHFFATQYLRNGGSILSLQKILGHSRLDVTERYLQYGHTDVMSEHQRFSPASTLQLRTVREPLKKRNGSD